MNIKSVLLLIIIIPALCQVKAQALLNTSAYNPQDYFLFNYNPPAGSVYRSAMGIPGPQYWQNRADYVIRATLSEQDTSISGNVVITYANNSPDKLEYLWLQLEQNLFDPSSRGLAAIPPDGDRFDGDGHNHGGYKIESVSVTSKGITYDVNPIVTDTRMQLRLKQAMLPKGDQVKISIKYRFDIPANGCNRFGRLYTSNGVVYTLAQWYPRMCVYDDVDGWNTLPYMNLGEFYCEYGNFDYFITAPAAMTVYGSGDLQNASEVLTPVQIKRLAQALTSNKTISIVGADEVGTSASRPKTTGNLTWHYTMKNTRDVAFAASTALMWDVAKVNLPSGRKALAMSAYPVASKGDTAWSRATEYLKYSIEEYSKEYFEYPWNNAFNIGCNISGMEYPGMIFNDHKDKKASLWFVISHEIGHNWFPMIVGSNERKYMWQDEGFNSFINYKFNETFNNGEYAKDTALFRSEHFAWFDKSKLTERKFPLMTITDAMKVEEHYEYYAKTAYGLKLLREVVIGKERFDFAFKKYTEAWAYKHPTPYDFFNCINNAAGEDLTWFWKGWFFTKNTLDQELADVKYADNDAKKGALITINNKGKMIFPAIVQVTESNGKISNVQLPVEVWHTTGTWTFKVYTTSKINKVVLDPAELLPDIDRSNNTWKAN